ncbi:MAG: hypothetical protein FWG28_02560 [Clostridiales bacterium]|nr:hypothetical protein [Clostridiales bacterium]
MKILTRMLLIHWYFFTHEMIEFDRINFLTGKNSSGKSTIIDAMQLVLLSDTSGSYFNRAANQKGNRTLTGYLRCELGDEEGAGFRYLRNGRFTSYVVLEFVDDAKGNFFSAGCCFDTFGENDVQRLFFQFNGPIPENEFVEQSVPLNIEGLRAFLRANYPGGQSYTTNVNRDFREALCGSLGGLQPQRFTDLIKKTVSFDPDVKIEKFITEFVCGEELEINIADMKENIRSYDSLKKESQILQERIVLLAKIGDAHDVFIKNKDNETLYSYLLERAAWETKRSEIEACKQNIERLAHELRELGDSLVREERQQAQLQTERDALKLQLDSDENAKRLEGLQKEIDEKKRQCGELINTFEIMSARLHQATSSWKTWIVNIREKILLTNLSEMDPLLGARIEAVGAEGDALLEKAGPLREAKERDAEAELLAHTGSEKLVALAREADDYRDRCVSLSGRLTDAQEEMARRLAELAAEKESLEKGVYRFPQDAIDLKEAVESRLRSKYGPEAKAVILAEEAEIRGDRWRDVVEGYLHTQKFYVIVAPEHFYTAFQLYDSIKRQKSVYTTGLVDTEKLQRMSPVRDEGSLAEELETEDAAVRLFIDFTLGRVRKCDSIKELRKFRTSVTDDGVLYQNFVVRAMDPKRWKDPAIGRTGARLRLEKVKEEISWLQEILSVLIAIIPALKETDRFFRLDAFMVGQIIDSAKKYLELPLLAEAIQRLTADAESIDKSAIEILRQRLGEREDAIMKNRDRIREIFEKVGSAKDRFKSYEEETLPGLESEEEDLREALEASYDREWADETGSQRYEREISRRESAEEISRAFHREQSRSRNAKEEYWEKTRDFRLEYNGTYKTGYDVNDPDNAVYHNIWLEYTENRLPEYETKIEDTRNKAFQQFQEDFLSKLQSNIRNARQHIDELNAAMKFANFGEDTYQFRVTANPDHEIKRYYDMIVDEMLLFGGYNLLSGQYNEKYREEIAELFEMLTNDGGPAKTLGYDDYEKRVQHYTDYKTYLKFDLEVIKPGGESERLSRTMGKKSGGETQTPFYVAVLASFVQLYRIGRDKTANTTRLILFDEAFSKMDGERIIQSIGLLRRFQFQVIFAAPPDKIPDVGALADRNLGVLREGQKTCVRAFDPRQLEEFADEA